MMKKKKKKKKRRRIREREIKKKRKERRKEEKMIVGLEKEAAPCDPAKPMALQAVTHDVDDESPSPALIFSL